MLLTTHSERPRELRWHHAGPMLYGDWGTSRFYVLGLAFYYALYASFWYVLGVGILVAAVGWAYTVICRSYPDGGGVYSAARQISPTLSVIGALLLFADYAVTAALSAFDGMHYFGADGRWTVAIGACLAIIALGVINFVGPKKAGTFALLCAGATLVCTLILVGFSIPHLSAGWHNVARPAGTAGHQWRLLVNVVLALSGVEAVANMTGIMVQPVAKTAKKSIFPVLIEVVGFNILLAVAMLALRPAGPGDFKQPAFERETAQRHFVEAHPTWEADPTLKAQHDALPHASELEDSVKNTVLKVMGEQFVGEWFGKASGVVFGLLLFSAVNTVLGGMISICFVMARDNELPRFFQKLNAFGVPWWGLIPAVVIPVVLLILFGKLESLADLYAIGVVGAIAINLCSCTINTKLAVQRWERAALGVLGGVMIAIELTLAWEKHAAVVFVSVVLITGLGMRFITRNLPAARAKRKSDALPPVIAPPRAGPPLPMPVYGTPADQLDMSLPHIMVATRGVQRLLEFAAKYTQKNNGILFVVYIRQINVPFATQSENGPRFEEDDDAKRTFAMAMQECTKVRVPMVPIYVVSSDVAYSILDFAATYNVDSLLMGISRRGTVLRALQGDTITAVAEGLPAEIPLLIHA
jgi:amino acid transporter